MNSILVLALLPPGLVSAAAFEPNRLTLVWYDSRQVFPAGGLARLAEEVEELFAAHGMEVRLELGSSGGVEAPVARQPLNVIVMPGDGEAWGLGRETMAAAIGREGKYNIFVFLPGVRRTLGHEGTGDDSPREIAELARATARILAHEVVHVLAPERGHAESGLMSSRLRRRQLLEKVLGIDEASLSLARRGFETRAGGPELLALGFPFPPCL